MMRTRDPYTQRNGLIEWSRLHLCALTVTLIKVLQLLSAPDHTVVVKW